MQVSLTNIVGLQKKFQLCTKVYIFLNVEVKMNAINKYTLSSIIRRKIDVLS